MKLSTVSAHLMYFWACAATIVSIPICYVGSLYLFDRHQLHTDHPQTIKKRLWGVYLSTSAICIWTYYLIRYNHDDPLYLMGLYLDSNVLSNVLKAVGLTSSIYLGTFLINYLDGSLNLHFDISSVSFLISWRNIVIAPLSEELVFRACLAVLLRLSTSDNIALYFGPMFFSICHYHHIRNDVKHGYTLSEAILERTVQALYTYVFGVYATYLFFGTHNLIPPTLAHALCNQMGLPRVFDVDTVKPKSKQLVVYLTHITGVALFIYLLPFMGH